jgi:hypothetical protein
VCIFARDQWLFSWRSSVVSRTLTRVTSGGVVRRGLDIGRVMFDMWRGGSVLWRYGDVDDMNDEVYANLYPVNCSGSMVVTIFYSMCMRYVLAKNLPDRMGSPVSLGECLEAFHVARNKA